MKLTDAHAPEEADTRISAAKSPDDVGAPEVSFAIAAYNAEPFIAQTLDSILSQTHDSFEVIVVDDASTDGTAKIVSQLAAKNPRIRLIANERRSGPAAARNRALEIAKGKWFAVVDADDSIGPTRTARLLEIAELTEADIVADNFSRYSHETNEELGAGLIGGPSPYLFLIDATAYLSGNVMFSASPPLGYLKPMFRLAFLRCNRLAYSERLQIGEDYDYCLRCLVAGARYVATSESHYRYRVREGSQSWRISASQLEELLRAHRELTPQCAGRDADFDTAAKRYEGALERALAFAALVDSLKSRRWSEACALLVSRLDLLSLLAQSFRGFAAKRLRAGFLTGRT